MVQIKIYKENTYYKNTWGDKEYLNGAADDVLISAALLTGKGLQREEEIIYTAYGETINEAEKALANYLTANPEHALISRKEISE